MADDPLLTAAKAGDAEAWRELYRMHAGRLVVWLETWSTGDSATSAEDIAHEAWVVAASRIADFSGSASDFGGWLFGIARKVSASSSRTARRRATHPGEVDDLVPAAQDDTQLVLARDWVRDQVASLPPKERDAVALVDGLGLDPQEAAEALGVSRVALRVARHRGLQRLRKRHQPTETGLRPDPVG